MARRGQVGTIAVSGKWYVVRFWKYPAGQNRIHASERICPTDPKAEGYLPKGERRRKANEIVEASGVNDAKQFVEATVGTTFRDQAKQFMNHSMNRRRKPIKPATAQTWQNCVDKWLNPNLGDLPLASVNNATVKELIAKMYGARLSPKSISNYVGLVKLIVGSAIDENGEELFPRKWNHEFMDLPVVEDQHQPTFTADTMSAIVEKATGQERVLYAFLAGSGVRVGEALGLEARHLSPDCRTITIEQSLWEGDLQTPKTKNAHRKVDVCESLANLLQQLVTERSGLLFVNGSGKPLLQTNVLRRSLHPILNELGVPKAGFHAMRRFRTTWLRKRRAPEDLIKFWLGHSRQTDVTDGYSKLNEDVEFRLEVAEQVGVGFNVPTSMRPMRPKNSEEVVEEVAA